MIDIEEVFIIEKGTELSPEILISSAEYSKASVSSFMSYFLLTNNVKLLELLLNSLRRQQKQLLTLQFRESKCSSMIPYFPYSPSYYDLVFSGIIVMRRFTSVSRK